MSLEAAIAENTKALMILTESVNKSNDLNERMIGLKSEAIETVKQTATKPADPAPKASKTTEAPKTEEAKAEAPKTEEKPLDPIGQAIADYVGGGYDAAHPQAKEERAARAGKVREIFAAIAAKGGVTVEKHSEIPEKFHKAFLSTLAKRVEEGALVIGKGGDDEDLGL